MTSANGLDTTTYTDSTGALDGSGNYVFNLITTNATVNNSGGGTTITQTDYSNAGCASGTGMLGQTVTTVSADGLTTTTKIDSTGNGTFDQTDVDRTTVDGSGNRTRVITEANANGTVYGEQVIVNNADGVTGTTSDYVNFGSGLVFPGTRRRPVARRELEWTPSPASPPMAREDWPDGDDDQRQWPCHHDRENRSERLGHLRVHHESTTVGGRQRQHHGHAKAETAGNGSLLSETVTGSAPTA